MVQIKPDKIQGRGYEKTDKNFRFKHISDFLEIRIFSYFFLLFQIKTIIKAAVRNFFVWKIYKNYIISK